MVAKEDCTHYVRVKVIHRWPLEAVLPLKLPRKALILRVPLRPIIVILLLDLRLKCSIDEAQYKSTFASTPSR